MKTYSTKAYFNYARKVLNEGEAAVAVDDNYKNVDNAQFKKLVASASVGAVGALACLKYLDRYFSINSLGNACTWLKEYSLRISAADTVGTTAQRNALAMKGLPNDIAAHNKGILKRLSASLAAAIERALSWVRKLAGTIMAKVPALKQPIANGSATYGSVLCMALAAAAVGAVIYKVYKVIKKRIDSAVETVESFTIKQTKRMKKALAESKAMFKDLDALIEGDAAGLVDSATGKVASGIGFINSVKAHIMVMFNDMRNFARYNTTLCVVIAVCAALIACWAGIKKFMDSKIGDAPVPATESAKPTAKKTIRRTATKKVAAKKA